MRYFLLLMLRGPNLNLVYGEYLGRKDSGHKRYLCAQVMVFLWVAQTETLPHHPEPWSQPVL